MKISTQNTIRRSTLESLVNDINENKLLYASFMGFVTITSIFVFILIAVQ